MKKLCILILPFLAAPAFANISASDSILLSLSKNRTLTRTISAATLWSDGETVTIHFADATISFNGKHLSLGQTLANAVGKAILLQKSDTTNPITFAISR